MPTRRCMAFSSSAHLLAQLGIERGERLVEQQHVGLQHQRARQRHALPLAARKLGGTARFLAGEADQFQHFAHALRRYP